VRHHHERRRVLRISAVQLHRRPRRLCRRELARRPHLPVAVGGRAPPQ